MNSRKKLVVLALTALIAACSPLQNYVKGPSDPAYLASSLNSTSADIDLMNADLTRNQWYGDGVKYNVAVAPVTGALIEAIMAKQSRKEGLEDQRTAGAIEQLKTEYVSKNSTFDVFVRGYYDDKGSTDSGKLTYYDITLTDSKGETHKGKILEAQYGTAGYVLKNLIREYLPNSVKSESRSVIGYGAYSRELVVFDKIDMTKPFSITVQPRYDEKQGSRTLSWDAAAQK